MTPAYRTKAIILGIFVILCVTGLYVRVYQESSWMRDLWPGPPVWSLTQGLNQEASQVTPLKELLRELATKKTLAGSSQLVAGSDTSADAQQASSPWLFVHFWATWCAPCEQELPLLAQLSKDQEFRSHYKMILVSVDTEPSQVSHYLKEKKLSFSPEVVFLTDPQGSSAQKWGTVQYPETYLVDPPQASFPGKILRKLQGAQGWGAPLLREWLRNPKEEG